MRPDLPRLPPCQHPAHPIKTPHIEAQHVDFPRFNVKVPQMALFTAATARQAALKSVEVQRQKRSAEAQRRLLPASAPLQAPAPPAVDDYTRLRLVCVRSQLGLVDAAILKEAGKDYPDGQRLNWLAAAQERLAEQERVLAGRPMPGSLRPTAAGKQHASAPMADSAPWIPEPSPAAPAAQVEPPPAAAAPGLTG